MNTLRLRNYRCFEDTGNISLKPLTFLVGANSSGKSSFLKFFPLLKQSIGIRKNGVFLWYSDDVDFKDFKNTVRNGEKNITINMELNLIDNIAISENKIIFDFFTRGKINYNGAITNIELTISEIDENADYLKHLTISYHDQLIEISFSKEGNANIEINGQTPCKASINPHLSNSFLPRLLFSNGETDFFMSSQIIRNKVKEYLVSCNETEDLSTKENELFFKSFYFLKKEIFCDCFGAVFKKRKNTSIDMSKLNDLYLLYNLNNIIDLANVYIHSMAMNISYVKPLRVTPERYYRYQNYSVNEISSDGKNLAMYFANLKKEDLKRFQKWTSGNFGFEIEPHKLEGHVEIDIKEKSGNERNLVDIGFGYNQLLPILAIIWNSLNNRVRTLYYPFINHVVKYIVIEQPELHLHPRILEMFAEMLCTIISNLKKNEDVRFIIETHSETIINKIGSLIHSSKLDENKVNVVLFNAKNEGLHNYVEQASYDEKGYLNNWPIGFFL
ncbi:MAG: AAA family ATPase [Bacteroidales bacterium]|nr:AAA family ATPase [Bacteroidales bacterium]